MLALENMFFAVGMTLLSCLEAKINVFPAWRLLSSISHFRFGSAVLSLVPLNYWAFKTYFQPLEALSSISHVRFGRT